MGAAPSKTHGLIIKILHQTFLILNGCMCFLAVFVTLLIPYLIFKKKLLFL